MTKVMVPRAKRPRSLFASRWGPPFRRQTLLREWTTALFIPLFSLDEGTAAFTEDTAIDPDKRVFLQSTAALVLEGIRAGARGFMLKDVSYEQLIAAIRAVAGGATVFQPAITERLLRVADQVHVESLTPIERLTPREIEVVRLMSGGYSNREIAYALGTAEGTIKNQVSSILAKFGVRDRTRAVLKALETGLLSASCGK